MTNSEPVLTLASFDPGRYGEISVLELLRAASRGWIGVDQRLIQNILDRGRNRFGGCAGLHS